MLQDPKLNRALSDEDIGLNPSSAGRGRAARIKLGSFRNLLGNLHLQR